jgi:DNA-binding IclR family transcriptional regulator
VSASADAMRQLRDATRETAAIAVRSETQGVVLEQYPSPQPFRFVIDPGSRFKLHTSAPGKAMLAFLPDDERDRVVSRLDLHRCTARTLVTVSALTNELKEIRRDGWSADRGEEIDGCHCVGAPILDHQGLPIAAIWVTGPSNRLSLDMMASIAIQVKACATSITHRFGGNQRGHR